MDSPRQVINQPPHSVGQKFPGLRAYINAEAIPSPISVAIADQEAWDREQYYTCASDQQMPMSSSRYVAVDQGNSAPRFMRASTYAVPKDADLASTCAIPIAVACQPLAEQPSEEAPVPLVDFGPSGPPRCSRCAGYINNWCTWTRGGASWACNLCGSETEVANEYFSNLNPMTQPMRRLDHDQRPELNFGTVDFAVTEEYWATQPVPRLEPSFASVPAAGPSKGTPRPPVPMRVVFAVEVTAEAVESGFAAASCEAIRSALYDEPQTAPSHVAIVTFDREICFYDLSATLQQPHMLVVSDIEEVFVPLRDDLFVDPTQSRSMIESLLDSMPTRIFAQTTARASALLPALRSGLAALADTGGHLVAFAHSLPSHGPGALLPRTDESALHNTGKERELFVPRDRLWAALAEECAEAGVGASLVLGPRRFIDVGSIGVLPTLTGGEILFFPSFAPERDTLALARRVRRLVARDGGYDVSVRVRCSKGLRVSGYAGTHHQTAPSTVSLGVLSRDRALVAVLEHSGTLNEREMAYVQCATLYTARTGQRRVRVLNLALPVSGLAGNVFRLADVETVATYLARRAVARMTSRTLREIKEELTEQTCTMLLAYRRNCAASTAPSQLILPEALKILPLYALGILKTKCLKGGSVNSDVRNFHAHIILSWGVRELIRHLYPLLLPLHRELPHPMRTGYHWMEPDGLYVIDNGVYTVLWIGHAADPQLLHAIFGTSDIRGVPDWHREMHGLPVFDNPQSVRVRAIVDATSTGQLLLARQGEDGTEMAFGDMLVEDCNNDAMSYVDYLCFVHKHINAALTGETSIGQTMGFRASTPW